jgi:hypothetical protein
LAADLLRESPGELVEAHQVLGLCGLIGHPQHKAEVPLTQTVAQSSLDGRTPLQLPGEHGPDRRRANGGAVLQPESLFRLVVGDDLLGDAVDVTEDQPGEPGRRRLTDEQRWRAFMRVLESE